MNHIHGIGRFLVFSGIVLIIAGVVFLALSKFMPYGWRLPGDIYIKKDNFVFYFPLATSIILSIILTIIFRLLGK